ncbi:hypothetical protein GCU67_17200 [Modestobacter muralis]|uniref:Uncharacterized protein n=1 Tax=Modestobacter muralis TaxID=1608614 RepID=A0A6P0EZI1_9ACTN|nr:hypothetical protein [Modestobacter muralis]NEK95886.1 hypothetical protein [Modestobacter muralis]NEN52774.1 hypothetical protein [Modestobacter muralis]
MSAVLPAPVPLPDPPGSAAALGAVLDQLTSAGFAAGLTVHLLQPAAAVPGWQGADAAAAAAEIAAAGTVAAGLHDALTAAAGRLGDHAELWAAVLARVASLREDQRHQFDSSATRLATLLADTPDAGATVPPAAVALVREVVGDDAARGAQHGALLADLADDAASAAALLGSLSAPFGGTARPGDVERVTLRLATVLPGWGDGALTALGVQAADELGGPGTAEQLDAAARRWTGYAAAPAFADALLGRLDEDGVTWLLTLLGNRTVAAEQEPLAGLLASAVGAAGTGSRAAEVLDTVRLDTADPSSAPDAVAVGMGLVLTALAAGGRAGRGVGLAVGWGGQLLAREAERGATAVERTTATLPDPVVAVLAVLVAAGDEGAAAALLSDPASWTRLLGRSRPGGVDHLVEVIGLASRSPQAAPVASSALQALGEGLRPGTTQPVVVGDVLGTAVGGAVTDLVAGRLDVVLPLLGAATGSVAGGVDAATDSALRGLGHLLVDGDRARTLSAAVHEALAAGPGSPVTGLLAGGFVAVEEYGQRLGYVLAHARALSWEVDQQLLWDVAVTLPVKLVTWRNPYGPAVEAVVGEVQRQVGFDGTVDIGPDNGETHTAWDARRWAGAALGSRAGSSSEVGLSAEVGFARATAVLGRPLPPQPDVLGQLDDLQGDLPDRSR